MKTNKVDLLIKEALDGTSGNSSDPIGATPQQLRVLKFAFIDDIDVAYEMYSRLSTELLGRVLRSEEQWAELEEDPNKMIEEIAALAPQSRLKKLVAELRSR